MRAVLFCLLVLVANLGGGTVAASPPAEDWGYAEIIALVEARRAAGKPFQSVEELLAALPIELRSNFTFVHDTGNKFQDASPENPRAIVFTKRLFYTFNGHPSQKGHDSLEFLEFDPKRRRFEMREIVFEKKATGTNVRYSTESPKKCLECHGADPKPIWSEYNRWPGVYGSADDGLTGVELTNYRAFRERIKADPKSRYALLQFKDVAPEYPYGNERTGDYALRINLVLTKLLARLNALRIARALKESPYYPHVKWLLPRLTDSHGCDVPDKTSERLAPFLNEMISRHMRGRAVPEATGHKLFLAMGLPVERFTMQLGANRYRYEDGTENQLPVLRYALLRDLAQDDATLRSLIKVTHAHHSDRYEAQSMYRAIDGWIGTVSAAENAPRDFCRYVGEKAAEQLDALEKDGLPRVEFPGDRGSFEAVLREAENRRLHEAIPSSCVVCHTVKEGAPRISFDDSAKLRQELSERDERLLKQILQRAHGENVSGDRRMPPAYAEEYSPLSAEQIRAMETYLRDVIAGRAGASTPSRY